MSIQADRVKLEQLLAKVEIAFGLVGGRRCDFDRAIAAIEFCRDTIERGTPICRLSGLSETIIDVLDRSKVQTVEELVLMTDGELLSINGIHRSRMLEIDIALTGSGYNREGVK